LFLELLRDEPLELMNCLLPHLLNALLNPAGSCEVAVGRHRKLQVYVYRWIGRNVPNSLRTERPDTCMQPFVDSTQAIATSGFS